MVKVHIPHADRRQHDEAHFDVPELTETYPFALFAQWYQEASDNEPADPNAMSLATVDADMMPNVRILLLKELDDKGFVFFTNYNSTKGKELEQTPKASMCFHWKSILKQVRIRGVVEKIIPQQSDAYFQTRDRNSRIGAWVSQQSTQISGRDFLLKGLREKQDAFGDQADIPRPDYWGGYRLLPLEIEFWRNGAYRLHDRLFCYRQSVNDDWTFSKLSP